MKWHFLNKIIWKPIHGYTLFETYVQYMANWISVWIDWYFWAPWKSAVRQMTNFKRFCYDKFYDYYDKKSLNLNYDILSKLPTNRHTINCKYRSVNTLHNGQPIFETVFFIVLPLFRRRKESQPKSVITVWHLKQCC